MADSNSLTTQCVLDERSQGHSSRKNIYEKLEELLGIPVIAYFTSFQYPVMIDNGDADLLEDVLHGSDLSKGFALIINSPGGDGLAAERIINICRSHSGTGEYIAVVPAKAKSAATMIAFGASKIMMGATSELGPIDPQIAYPEEGRVFSAYNIVRSYEEIFAKAVNEKGNLDPYLQQLAKYDAREIEDIRSAISLSKDIAIKALKTGMMKRESRRSIEDKIRQFTVPDQVMDHGRAIYAPEAIKCGLKIAMIPIRSEEWRLFHELYIRMNSYVSSRDIAKCIENKNHSYHAEAEK